MAITTESFNADGALKIFTPASHILSQSHCRVHYYYDDGSGVATDHPVVDTAWDVINNSIVFQTPPAAGYVVKLTISTDGEGLSTAPSIYSSLASNVESIVTTADSIVNVNAVAASIANVNTVGDSIAKVNAVGASIAKVNTVADSIANVNTVADSIANVNTVSSSIVKVNTVGDSIASVNTVAHDIIDVNTVADNITNVNNIASIIVPNLTEILQADTSATVATEQANTATDKASIATTKADTATTQAGVASNAASLATDKATIATSQANIATTQATIATTQAVISATQAVIATEQAIIVTEQAIIATDKADIATAKADEIQGYIIPTEATYSSQIIDNKIAVVEDIALEYLTNVELGMTLFETKLASPTFTGTPTAPTAPVGTNSTQLATTEFVRASFVAISGVVSDGTVINPPAGYAQGDLVSMIVSNRHLEYSGVVDYNDTTECYWIYSGTGYQLRSYNSEERVNGSVNFLGIWKK